MLTAINDTLKLTHYASHVYIVECGFVTLVLSAIFVFFKGHNEINLC